MEITFKHNAMYISIPFEWMKDILFTIEYNMCNPQQIKNYICQLLI